jgi:hypothetical protein
MIQNTQYKICKCTVRQRPAHTSLNILNTLQRCLLVVEAATKQCVPQAHAIVCAQFICAKLTYSLRVRGYTVVSMRLAQAEAA